MSEPKILFSVNEYDKDGDLVTEGVFLHIGDVRIKTGDSLADFDAFAEQLRAMRQEVAENYPEFT